MILIYKKNLFSHALIAYFLFKCRVCCNYTFTWSATWSSLLGVILSSHMILAIGIITLVHCCYQCMISITSVSSIKETWIDSGIANSFLIDKFSFCIFYTVGELFVALFLLTKYWSLSWMRMWLHLLVTGAWFCSSVAKKN